MFGLGTTELIVIAIIIILIFGAKRLPEIGKGIGGAIREFRNVKKELNSEKTDDTLKKETASPQAEKTPSLENRLAEKVVNQVPGIKKAMDVKKKAETVKELLK